MKTSDMRLFETQEMKCEQNRCRNVFKLNVNKILISNLDENFKKLAENFRIIEISLENSLSFW